MKLFFVQSPTLLKELKELKELKDGFWNHHSKRGFCADSLSPLKEPQKATKGGENTGVSEKPVNADISKPKAGTIEDFGNVTPGPHPPPTPEHFPPQTSLTVLSG